MIEVPRDIVWDYPEPPKDELWRLQRIADFFPQYGRDRETVRALCRRRKELRVPREVLTLIEIYANCYQVRDAAP